MKFLPPEKYQRQALLQFAKYKKWIEALIPTSTVEHIGASSIPRAISKGDLDIYVGVDRMNFDEALKTLIDHQFEIKINTLRTSSLVMLVPQDGTPDVAIQLVENGSEFEAFLNFRDLLRANPQSVEDYNRLKLSCEHLDETQYRLKKSEFIDRILAQSKT